MNNFTGENKMLITVSDDDGSDREGLFSEEVVFHGDRAQDALNEDIHAGGDRLVKSRERNREHARKTRLRKKSLLQGLKHRAQELESERKLLKQSIEECSIASILLNLSGNGLCSEESQGLASALKCDEACSDALSIAKKRKRLASDDSDLVININGRQTIISGNGKTHVNWKTGVYTNDAGDQHILSSQELEALRRERNRRHAKMTRDRKKIFVTSMKDTIAKLEQDNERMRHVLALHSPTLSAVCTAAGSLNT